MLLKTDLTLDIDRIRIHFDTESLWILNIAIGIIMFGVALGITTEDFRRLIRNPKILLTGIFSQFISWWLKKRIQNTLLETLLLEKAQSTAMCPDA